MLHIRSEKRKVGAEKRQDPRIEFHCDAKVPEFHGVNTITGISFNGLFLETSDWDIINVGRVITINTRFHPGSNVLRLKAKVMRQTNRGIGCKFVELNDQRKEDIRSCFEHFRDTLPIR